MGFWYLDLMLLFRQLFVLMFDMLAGRLELLPMIVLFSPLIWRKDR